MVAYKEHKLSNGLQLIIHTDTTTPMVCLNILYKVGSRNEDPERTGFAHLFEHLMFGGSKHVEHFDEPLQAVGGDNNAFTNTDITNYYITIPADNVETAFWLESDRMLSLSFDPQVLEIQRKVVIEEFKQRYLNQPYGDVWLKLRPLAYKEHPYRWPTIGKEVSHIERATMDDVKHFFKTFYNPGNAVLVVAGNITEERALSLTEKWFGTIAQSGIDKPEVPSEPDQSEERKIIVEGNVPVRAIYKAYKMGGRQSKSYHATDLLGDIIGHGKSSILHEQLVKKERMFSSIGAYNTGSYDPGLLVISGKLLPNFELAKADEAIKSCIADARSSITEEILQKAKNQSLATSTFGEVELLNRAMGLAYANFLGDTELVNHEQDIIQHVNLSDIFDSMDQVLQDKKCSTLFYEKAK